MSTHPARTWLITGASGLLGTHLCQALVDAGQRVIGQHFGHNILVDRVQALKLNLLDTAALSRCIIEAAPDVVIHAAGLTNVDECERNEALATQIHVDVSSTVATACATTGSRLLHISTDHLWDGTRAMVAEDTPMAPLNAYARTKASAEHAVLAADKAALVVRTNFFGPGLPWRRSFSDWVLHTLQAGEPITAFADVFFTPITVDDLSNLMISLAETPTQGLLHVAGSERISKYDFVVAIANAYGLPTTSIRRGSVAEAHLAAPRPRDMSLSTTRVQSLLGHAMPTIGESLRKLVTEPPLGVQTNLKQVSTNN